MTPDPRPAADRPDPAEAGEGIILDSAGLDRLLHNDPDVIHQVLGSTGVNRRISERQLVRPEVRWFRLIVCILSVLLPILACIWVWQKQEIPPVIKVLLTGAVLVVIWIAARQLVLHMITVYQHFAPEEVRRRCKCFPSCSEYTAQAVRKYGPVRGLFLGYRRLRRCGSQVRGDDPLP